MAFGLQTYQDANRREDLIDVITDVSPDENPLMTMLGTTKASNTLHEWTEDYIARPTSVANAAEGAAATYGDLTQPSRRNNRTGIVTQTFRVSGTESAAQVAGIAHADPRGRNLASVISAVMSSNTTSSGRSQRNVVGSGSTPR